MQTKKTKIVATIGPASEGEAVFAQMVEAGLDVARLNFSHGDHAEHEKRVHTIRRVSKAAGRPVAILQDLCGPKIRLGDFAGGSVTIKTGDKITLTTKACPGDASRVSVSYKRLPREVKAGDTILLEDGKKRLTVLSTDATDIVCRIEVGGDMKGRRGVNVPKANLTIDCLTAKDRVDLHFGVRHNVDFFALSFVHSADDIRELRAILKREGSTAGIIAKIETAHALTCIDEIIAEADGIMVARGDLAVEVSHEEVPLIQKSIIRKCNLVGKPVITATQMLESMTRGSVPTRAEVSDVANAILDGSDAVMLSEETAMGANPIEAIRVMTRVALRVENEYLHRKLLPARQPGDALVKLTDSVTSSAVLVAESVGARAIVALTLSGRSARMISRHKPLQQIFALSPSEQTCRQLALSFGVWPVKIAKLNHFENVLSLVRNFFIRGKIGVKGEKVVIASGLPFGKTIDINMVLVERL